MTLELVKGGTAAPEKLELRTLKGRYRCLVRLGGVGPVYTVVLCESKLSPSREYIQLGDYYSDMLRGWVKADLLEVLEVLEKIKDEPPPAPRPWWKRRPRITFR